MRMIGKIWRTAVAGIVRIIHDLRERRHSYSGWSEALGLIQFRKGRVLSHHESLL